MKVRTLKHRQCARSLEHARIWAPDRFDVSYDEYDDGDDDYGCTHCGGEGYREVEDPMWDECDAFGFGPCTSCRGTGKRGQQWVF